MERWASICSLSSGQWFPFPIQPHESLPQIALIYPNVNYIFKYYQYGTSKCTGPILPAGSRLGGMGFRVPKSFEMSEISAGFVLRSWIKPRWDGHPGLN